MQHAKISTGKDWIHKRRQYTHVKLKQEKYQTEVHLKSMLQISGSPRNIESSTCKTEIKSENIFEEIEMFPKNMSLSVIHQGGPRASQRKPAIVLCHQSYKV